MFWCLYWNDVSSSLSSDDSCREDFLPPLYLEFRVGAAPPPALNLTNTQEIVYHLLFLILQTPKAFVSCLLWVVSADWYIEQYSVNALAKHRSPLGQYIADISADSQSSMGWVSVECRSSIGWASAKYWAICWLSLDQHLTNKHICQHLDWYPTETQLTPQLASIDTQPTLDWLLANIYCQPIYIGCILVNSWPIEGRYLADIWTECRSIYSLTVLTNTTCSERNPSNLHFMQTERLQSFALNDSGNSSPPKEVPHRLQSVSRFKKCSLLLESDLGYCMSGFNIMTNQGNSQGFWLAKFEFGYANTWKS